MVSLLRHTGGPHSGGQLQADMFAFSTESSPVRSFVGRPKKAPDKVSSEDAAVPMKKLYDSNGLQSSPDTEGMSWEKLSLLRGTKHQLTTILVTFRSKVLVRRRVWGGGEQETAWDRKTTQITHSKARCAAWASSVCAFTEDASKPT